MRIRPKVWTHHHTQRLYHVSMLAAWLFIIGVVSGGIFSVLGEASADQTSYPPIDETVSATVPGVEPGPTIVQNSGGGGQPASTATSAPPLLPGAVSPTVVINDPSGENVSKQQVNVNGKLRLLFVFNTQYPSFSGWTNISNAVVFFEIHNDILIHGGVYTDQNGNWRWQSSEPVSPGYHTITISAQSLNLPEIKAKATYEFYVLLPAGKQPVKPSALLNIPSGEGNLFDVLVKILDPFKVIVPGDQLVASVRLINFGSPGNAVDVPVQYTITDSSQNVVSQTSETVAVATQVSLLKTFNTNPAFKAGNYTITVRVPSKFIIASSADTFEVKGKPVIAIGSIGKIDFTLTFQIMLGMLFLFILIAYLEYNKVVVLSRIIKKVDEGDLNFYNKN